MSQSTSGEYWTRLDHVRGLAAFLVFTWHFIHVRGAIPFGAAPGLSILGEGHTGVSLFMVLSGYLFAKIVGERDLDYGRFLFNRALRLGPLLGLALLVAFTLKARTTSWPDVVRDGLLGLLVPYHWPWGTWSVAIEAQFYVLLPALLAAGRRTIHALTGLIAVAVIGRAAAYGLTHNIQDLAYYTLAGRIDQFVFGILAWRLGRGGRVNPVLMAGAALAFFAFFHQFYAAGGWRGTAGSPIWVVLPTAEGAFYALLIAWYDGGRWSLPAPFAIPGKVSYSIYLLHFAPTLLFAGWLATRIDLANPAVALAASVLAFIAFLPVAWLSWRWIETPLTARRLPYLREAPAEAARPIQQAA